MRENKEFLKLAEMPFIGGVTKQPINDHWNQTDDI